MKNDNPCVSIGLPVYNGEMYLEEAIHSILAQTFSDFEVLISDNASTDRTSEICADYAARDKRIKYYRNATNIGAARNFNRVFELSSGKYFRWHACDDLCDVTLVEKCVAELDRNPTAVLCSPKACLIDAEGRVFQYFDDNLDVRNRKPHQRLHNTLLKMRLCNAQYGLMRSEILKGSALEGDYPGSDMVFLAELSLYGDLIQLDEYLLFRRIHQHASHALQTVEEQQEFCDPTQKGRLFLREWRHLFEMTKAMRRSPLNIIEKMLVLNVICRGVRWRRKSLWREVTQAIQFYVPNLRQQRH